MTFDLIEHFQTMVALSPSLKEFLSRHLTALTLSHNEFWLQPFQVCGGLAFLTQGQMHAYRKVGGHRITCRFYFPGDLVIDPTGYLSQKPSAVYIAPVRGDCVLQELNAGAKAVASQFLEWPLLWEKLLAGILLADEAMLYMFRTMCARQRYEWAHRFHPDIRKTVRMRQFASWIGVSSVTVYEIEKQDRMAAQRKRQTG